MRKPLPPLQAARTGSFRRCNLPGDLHAGAVVTERARVCLLGWAKPIPFALTRRWNRVLMPGVRVS